MSFNKNRGAAPRTHTLPIELLTGSRSSVAFLALDSSGETILFIHGFRGRGVSTWTEFDSRLTGHAACARTDLIFYEYESRLSPIDSIAHEFFEFIDGLFGKTSKLQPHRTGSPTRLTIVAHSLGAIIARKALLWGVKAGRPWSQCCRLVLFAPADRGTDVPALLREGVSSFAGVFGWVAWIYWWPTLRGLEDPAFYQKLESETREALDRGGGGCLRALRVVFAHFDKVTRQQAFCDDPYYPDPHCVRAAAANHANVCKPTASYPLPVQVLIDTL
jgi:pimeloyl-ACP methyl ester carboxylesterase